jgi:hypothetical protein
LASTAPSVDTRIEYADLVRAVHRECLRLRPGLRCRRDRRTPR